MPSIIPAQFLGVSLSLNMKNPLTALRHTIPALAIGNTMELSKIPIDFNIYNVEPKFSSPRRIPARMFLNSILNFFLL